MAYLQLSDGTKITFQGEIQIDMLSPLFYEMNTYSLPGQIPNTPENSKALDRPEIINSIDNQVREYDALFISNSLQLQGVLRVKEANDQYFKFNFTGQGAFWKKGGNTPMNKQEFEIFDYPDDILNATNFPIDDTDIFIFENAFVFVPHYNSIGKKTYEFYKEEIEKNYLPPVNDFYYPTGGLGIRKYTSLSQMESLWPNAIKGLPDNPWPTLDYIISAYCTKNGYQIKSNDLDQDKFKYLVVFNNHNLEQLTFTESTDPGDILTITNVEVIDENTLEITVSNSIYQFGYSLFFKLYNFTIESKNNINGRVFRPKETAMGKFQIEIDTSLFTTSSVSANVVKMIPEYSIPDSFEIGKHFPNLTAKEFFQQLDYLFGLKTIPGESTKQVRFRLMEDIIKDSSYEDITNIAGKITDKPLSETNTFGILLRPVEDDYYKERIKYITAEHTIKDAVATEGDLPSTNNSTNDVRFVTDKSAYYIWKIAAFGTRQLKTTTNIYLGNWEFFSEWIDYGDVDGDILFESKFAPIPKYGLYYLYGFRRDIPRVEIATNHENSTEVTDGGMRLMFFYSDLGFPTCNSENDELSLRLNGEKGIYENLHKNHIHWKQNRYRQCVCKIQWPVYLLNDFAWEKKVRIKDTNYLVEKFTMYIRHDDRIRFGNTELART